MSLYSTFFHFKILRISKNHTQNHNMSSSHSEGDFSIDILEYSFGFRLTYANLTSVTLIFGRFFGHNRITAVSSTQKISIKMFQIHQRICWEYSRNFRGLPIHSFAHAKVKKSNFNRKILELVGDFGIILNDFQSWFHLSY